MGESNLCHFGGNHIISEPPNQDQSFMMVYYAFMLIFFCKFWIFCFDVVKSNLDFQMTYEFATIGKDYYFWFDS
jgi:hypothetical protein